jgi:hypothetical protein
LLKQVYHVAKLVVDKKILTLTKKKKERPKPYKAIRKFTNGNPEGKQVDTYNTLSGFYEIGLLDPYEEEASVNQAV